jgi:hypothetical protein
MIRTSWTRMASVEETLALWAASLREIKQRIRPLFKQERVARNVGLFLEGLLGDEQRKTGWMRAEAAGDPGPRRQQAILKKFHMSEDLLSALNPGKHFDRAGETIAVIDTGADQSPEKAAKWRSTRTGRPCSSSISRTR